jgi:hypothetical protein
LLSKSPFSNANFDHLKAGDFFFHSLAGDHCPAIKVVRADGKEGVLDFHLEQQNGRHLPTLVSCDGFENLTVMAVQQAVIRPKVWLILKMELRADLSTAPRRSSCPGKLL